MARGGVSLSSAPNKSKSCHAPLFLSTAFPAFHAPKTRSLSLSLSLSLSVHITPAERENLKRRPSYIPHSNLTAAPPCRTELFVPGCQSARGPEILFSDLKTHVRSSTLHLLKTFEGCQTNVLLECCGICSCKKS